MCPGIWERLSVVLLVYINSANENWKRLNDFVFIIL